MSTNTNLTEGWRGWARMRSNLVGAVQMVVIGGEAASCAMEVVRLFDCLVPCSDCSAHESLSRLTNWPGRRAGVQGPLIASFGSGQPRRGRDGRPAGRVASSCGNRLGSEDQGAWYYAWVAVCYHPPYTALICDQLSADDQKSIRHSQPQRFGPRTDKKEINTPLCRFVPTGADSYRMPFGLRNRNVNPPQLFAMVCENFELRVVMNSSDLIVEKVASNLVYKSGT